MKQRGRKSAAALDAAALTTKRPEPLKHLTAQQKEIWNRVVADLPADWFPRETLDMLAEYCEQVTISRKLSKQILSLPNDAVADTEKLIRLKEKTARVMVTLATKMRMSQQATYHPEKSKNTDAPAETPWQNLRSV